MVVSKHPTKDMAKNCTYTVDSATLEKHQWRCKCECPEKVLNLMGDKRVWTRVEFECGEQIKINCQRLTKL